VARCVVTPYCPVSGRRTLGLWSWSAWSESPGQQLSSERCSSWRAMASPSPRSPWLPCDMLAAPIEGSPGSAGSGSWPMPSPKSAYANSTMALSAPGQGNLPLRRRTFLGRHRRHRVSSRRSRCDSRDISRRRTIGRLRGRPFSCKAPMRADPDRNLHASGPGRVSESLGRVRRRPDRYPRAPGGRGSWCQRSTLTERYARVQGCPRCHGPGSRQRPLARTGL